MPAETSSHRPRGRKPVTVLALWFQFRGHAANDTEWGIVELDPGEMAYVPRGIAHRINGGKGFLRMVFYSRQLVHPKAFNSSAGRHSTFEVQ